MKRRLALLAFAVDLMLGGASQAQSIAVNPDPPLIGSAAQYSLSGIPGNWIVRSYNWEYRWIGDCVSAWGPISANGSDTASPAVYESFPGSFNVRCTITYQVYPGPIQTATYSTTVIISPPTAVRIVAGLDTPTPVGTGIWVKFSPQAGGKDCGPYYGGQAQELVTNKVIYGMPRPDQDDTTWSPAQGVQANVFYHDGSPWIWDYKGQANDATLDSWPYLNTYYSCTQQIRMIYTDPCGNVKTYPIGTVKLARQLTGFRTWKLIQQ